MYKILKFMLYIWCSKERGVIKMENKELEKMNKSWGIIGSFMQYIRDDEVIERDMITVIEYIGNDILGGKTRSGWSRENGKTYPAHRYARGVRFVIGGVEFIGREG